MPPRGATVKPAAPSCQKTAHHRPTQTTRPLWFTESPASGYNTECLERNFEGVFLGVCWLLRTSRRVGRFTGSVVVFYERPISIAGNTLRIWGRKHPVEAHDFDRGREGGHTELRMMISFVHVVGSGQ